MDSWFQEYRSKMNSQSFISDCFEGQIITGVVVIIFVALFLLKEWVVQNLPAIDEAEHARAVNQLPPAILEPIFQDNIQLPDNLPASPVAAEEDVDEWLDYLSSNPKLIRAASMPPLSTNSSSSQSSGSNREFYENEFRRSASMEPLFNTQTEHETLIGRGNPPYAPIVRNADAPMMNIQPIAEEPEEDIVQQQQQVEPEAVDEEENNEEEEDEENEDVGNFGDDIEGVMEAIGMQGSFWVLAQNATLMAVLIALVLFIIVCLPYVFGVISILSVGKEVAGFPVEFIALVHRHIGKITDPLIDPLLTAYFDYLWPAIVFCSELYLKPLLEKCLGESARLKLFSMSSSNSTSSDVLSADGLSHGGVDHFITLYNQSKPVVESMFNRYQGFAVGESSVDRFSCILVGYVTIVFLTYIFLSRSKMLYTVFGSNAKEVLREYFVILKLTMFIAIELLIFPLVCGAVLDLSTLPLFEGATLMKRLEFLTTSPVSSIFIHWFLGTGFMFLFAVFVTLCRSIVRPGVMWFIRDPTDPQFHPLREIVERPVLFQYQKIGSSGLVYVFAIFLCIGGVVHTINLAGSAILPLRWSISTPLSTIPVDLLTTQLILPAAIGYLQPKRVIKKWFVNLIVFCCRQLCLSSFIFGERKPEEEGKLIYHTWSAWIQRAKPPYYPREGDPINIHGAQVSYIWNGQVLRVPSHDRVPVIPRRRMLVPVDPFIFEPLEETERNMGHPSSTADGGDEANTTLVYSPPDFYKRILALVIFVWIVSTVSLCAFAFVPLVLGRTIFQHRLKIEGNVHDIYSYTLGASLILFVWSVGVYFVRIMADVYRQRTMRSKLKRLSKHIRRWAVKTSRWGFFLASFGLVLPLAFGTILELYFALPTRGILKEPVELKIMPAWANGIASMVVAHGLIHILPENRWRRAITNTFYRHSKEE
ncbi:hypothetical protein CU098_011114 [Rhizopus stolonifer]|uniref:RING-type E3 ubiquitin transferase n=1 Tax=Rhizopus stolonifer TaxID=4846 RepID=A0A367KMT1_RHIST|nr:hypothetical protein CU098_011114 [Rhizopus stolonifer]